MKAEEIRNLSEKQLYERVAELKKEKMNLNFQRAAGELVNTSRFKVIRRVIARIKTILNEKK